VGIGGGRVGCHGISDRGACRGSSDGRRRDSRGGRNGSAPHVVKKNLQFTVAWRIGGFVRGGGAASIPERDLGIEGRACGRSGDCVRGGSGVERHLRIE